MERLTSRTNAWFGRAAFLEGRNGRLQVALLLLFKCIRMETEVELEACAPKLKTSDRPTTFHP